MSWDEWASGVLNGIGAPVNATNLDTLWAWSNKESGVDVMRWNNPLNTTERWPGSVPMNSVGVQAFASTNDGILATVATLDNGFYPVILANLRGSVPRAQWGNACGNLGTWGTGCDWLQSTFGPAPGSLTGDDLTPSEHAQLDEIYACVKNPGLGESSAFSDLAALIKAIPTANLAPVLAAIADLKAHPAVVADPSVLAIVTRIESGLKAA